MGLFSNEERERELESQIKDLMKDIAVLNKELSPLRTLKSREDKLTKDIAKLNEQLAELKLKTKIEKEDIEHLVKMKLEKNDLEFEKKVVALEKTKDKEISKVREEYRDKTEQQLDKRGSEMKEMYSEVLTRLPSVTAHIGDPTHGNDRS
jgi:chromosome segregation ATPase